MDGIFKPSFLKESYFWVYSLRQKKEYCSHFTIPAGQCPSDKNWISFGQRCYLHLRSPKRTYFGAISECQKEGAQLARHFLSENEKDFLVVNYGALLEKESMWTALDDASNHTIGSGKALLVRRCGNQKGQLLYNSGRPAPSCSALHPFLCELEKGALKATQFYDCHELFTVEMRCLSVRFTIKINYSSL